MKVAITYTIEVDADIRRSIRAFYGQDGLATRDEIRAWYEAYGTSMDMDLSQAADDRAEDEA